MGKINLNDHIWIKGGNTLQKINKLHLRHYEKGHVILYWGRTTDIPQEVIDEIDPDWLNIFDETRCGCGERDTCYYCNNLMDSTPRKLIEEACIKEFCLIYKTNQCVIIS